MKSKTVFITGSSRGIGKAIAQAFCSLGCNVAINGINTNRLELTRQELMELNPNVVSVQGDMSVYANARAAFEQIEKSFGNVDVLVNNAAIAHIGLFTDMAQPDWNRVIDVNINAMLNCSHLALPKMITKKSGCIINLSSMWGERGASCEAVYSLTKGAVNGFTKAIAKEVAPSGIRVNAIACGVIDTDMNAFLSPEERTTLINEIPLSRLGTPAEIADVAAFLASEKANYITGQIIGVDGGV